MADNILSGSMRRSGQYICLAGMVWLLSAVAAQTAPANAQSGGRPAFTGDTHLLELPGSTPTPATPTAPTPLPNGSPPATPVSPPAGGTPASPETTPKPANASSPSAPGQTIAPVPASAVLPTAILPSPALHAPTSQSKDLNLLLVPLHLGNMSLMFSKADMDIITPLIDVYDKTNAHKDSKNTASDKDDLSSLLQTLTNHEETPTAIPKILPNLYLGSIVYYSPTHWSVWINGKKLLNTYNTPKSEFYVSRLSRVEVELIWHPVTLLETPTIWQQLTGSGKHPLSNIVVDESKGTITLRMRPNQTFLPRTLSIREGLIKSVYTPPPVATK